MRELAVGMRVHGAFGLPEDQVKSMAEGLEETADKLEKESEYFFNF